MKDRKPSLEEWLQAHPELMQRIEALRDIVEDTACKVDKADDAEQAVIDELRLLGNDVLHDWAQCKQSQKIEETRAKECKLAGHGKKTPLVLDVRGNNDFGDDIFVEGSSNSTVLSVGRGCDQWLFPAFTAATY
jgi:hypothetical protein